MNHRRDVVAVEGRVAILGVTTGSHLDLPDDEEILLTVIWTADAIDARLTTWRIVADTPANRTRIRLHLPLRFSATASRMSFFSAPR